MSEPKHLVALTDDDSADYFPFDYPESLVQWLEVGEDGLDRESTVVTRLLAWLALKSGRSSDTRFEMSRMTRPGCWNWLPAAHFFRLPGFGMVAWSMAATACSTTSDRVIAVRRPGSASK
jgi:hypothetical protein